MIDLVRKVYWVFHMKWNGSETGKHIYATFAMSCFSGSLILFTLFIPFIGFGMSIVMSKLEYMAIVLAITGFLFTYLSCLRNKGYESGRNYFAQFIDDDIPKKRNKVMYKFAFFGMGYMATVGVIGYVLADAAGLIA